MNEKPSAAAMAQGDAPAVAHLSRDELEAGLDAILRSPADRGVLKAVVIRPETDARESLQRGVPGLRSVSSPDLSRRSW